MKTSSDSEDRNRSDEFKKGTFALKFLRKMQFSDFLEVLFSPLSKEFKTFLSRFPVSIFQTFFWLGLRLKNPTNNKFQPK